MARAFALAALLAGAAGCARAPVRPDEPRTRARPAADRTATSRGAPRAEATEGVLAEGLISYYGPGFHGRLTASGEKFDRRAMTAAHRKLPFGSCLVVENLANGRKVTVRVNDRGPYAGRRILDVSEAAAERLGMVHDGVTRARLWRCGKAR